MGVANVRSNPRALIDDVDRKFPVRIAVKVPLNGIRQRCGSISDWLDENRGVDGWTITQAGTRTAGDQAIAVYDTPTCAVAFVARWCVPGERPSFYDLYRPE